MLAIISSQMAELVLSPKDTPVVSPPMTPARAAAPAALTSAKAASATKGSRLGGGRSNAVESVGSGQVGKRAPERNDIYEAAYALNAGCLPP